MISLALFVSTIALLPVYDTAGLWNELSLYQTKIVLDLIDEKITSWLCKVQGIQILSSGPTTAGRTRNRWTSYSQHCVPHRIWIDWTALKTKEPKIRQRPVWTVDRVEVFVVLVSGLEQFWRDFGFRSKSTLRGSSDGKGGFSGRWWRKAWNGSCWKKGQPLFKIAVKFSRLAFTSNQIK